MGASVLITIGSGDMNYHAPMDIVSDSPIMNHFKLP